MPWWLDQGRDTRPADNRGAGAGPRVMTGLVGSRLARPCDVGRNRGATACRGVSGRAWTASRRLRPPEHSRGHGTRSPAARRGNGRPTETHPSWSRVGGAGATRRSPPPFAGPHRRERSPVRRARPEAGGLAGRGGRSGVVLAGSPRIHPGEAGPPRARQCVRESPTRPRFIWDGRVPGGAPRTWMERPATPSTARGCDIEGAEVRARRLPTTTDAGRGRGQGGEAPWEAERCGRRHPSISGPCLARPWAGLRFPRAIRYDDSLRLADLVHTGIACHPLRIGGHSRLLGATR